MVSATTGLAVLIFILIIVIAGLLGWGIYNYQQLQSRSVLISQNPYCIRFTCGTPGTQPVPISLQTSSDPVRTAYGTVNWCSTNAPTVSFANAMQSAALLDASSPEFITEFDTDSFKLLLENFGYFYVGTSSDPNTPNLPTLVSYTGTCGYTWKAEPTQFDPDAPGADELTNETLLGGINDTLWVNTVIVMQKLGFDTGTESQQIIYNRMKTLCGGPCAGF